MMIRYSSRFFALWIAACLVPKTWAQEPDPKYRSPRATVRTLYIAADLAREDPRHIEHAIGCLELSGRRTGTQFGGMIADRLEFVLSALQVKSYQLPDDTSLEEFTIPDTQGHRLVLKRMPNGHFCFDAATAEQVSRIAAELQKTAQTNNRDALDVRPELASPRATFRTFMKAMRQGDVHTATQCLDLRGVPAATRADVGSQLARRLRQVIDKSRLVVFQHIPDTNLSPPYVWLSQPSGLIDLQRQFSGDRKGEWLFSATTVQSIDRLYTETEGRPYVPEIRELVMIEPEVTLWGEPELWLRERLPPWAGTAVINTWSLQVRVYELLGIPLLLASTVGLFLLVRALATGIVRGVLRLLGANVPPETVRRRLLAVNVLVCLVYLRGGVLLLAMDKQGLTAILALLNPLIWICVAWVACRLMDLIRDTVEARMTMSERHVVASQMLMPVSFLSLKILILLASMFHLMHLFDWNVTAVLTGLGIGGLAFALGAQDSLKNLFGSFTLIADRPFIVGERVKIGQHGEGVVEVVGLRSTRIRTGEDAVLTVPNSDLTTMHITNYGRRRPCRFKTGLGVVYATPPERLLAFRDALRELIRQRVTTDKNKSSVVISDLVPAAVEIKIDIFFETTDRSTETAVREELIVEILRLAESLGITFSSPTQMVQLTLPAPEATIRTAGVPGRSTEAA